jgi:hypothetical protein
MKAIVGLLLSVVMFGCLSQERQETATSPDGVKESTTASEHRELTAEDRARMAIEAAAIAEVVKLTKLRPDQLEAKAKRDGEEWSVLMIYLPPTPGAHYFLRMSNAGEVMELERGA